MAKKNLGRLAGLAALAGAAYMGLKDKDKDKAKDSDSNSTRAARPESTETRLESPEDTIKRSSAKAPGDSKSITEADVVMPEKAAPVKPRVPAAAVADNTTGIRMPSGSPDAEAGMTRGTRTQAKPVSTVSSSAEGMKNYKPRRNSTPANTVSSSEEGMQNYKPRRPTPTPPFKGGRPGYDEAGNFLGGRRGYDEVGNPMKKGGKVKKMASGGMTASKRADGIASRGKTKCKMY